MSDPQTTDQILMVRPAAFGFNVETASSNSFQSDDGELTHSQIAELAVAEFDSVTQTLLEHDIDVFVIEDTAEPPKSDAVFPNNWISFHFPETLITWPLLSKSRRNEVRVDIIEDLEVNFAIRDIWRLDQQTDGNTFLEGTGSLVLDRTNRIAYACRSPRTDDSLIEQFCSRLNYSPVVFDAVYSDGVPVYHTNVIMAVTGKHVVICLDSIKDAQQKAAVIAAIEGSGKSIVDLSMEQIGKFAGNMLQVGEPNRRPILCMSQSAYDSLNENQIAILGDESTLLPMPIPTIEKYGGGSIRCMLAEIFVPLRLSVTE